MRYGWYEEKIESQICPSCKEERPYDWFDGSLDPRCWKCRSLKPLSAKAIEEEKKARISKDLAKNMSKAAADEASKHKVKGKATIRDYIIIVDGMIKGNSNLIEEVYGITRSRLRQLMPKGGFLDGHSIEFMKRSA